MAQKTTVKGWLAEFWRDATMKINVEEHHSAGGDKLIRQMGLFSVILFTITSAVGSGILTTPGIIAHDYAGPYAYMSYVKAGIICICPALCLAYMASRTFKSGSTGSYACLVLGQLPGLLMFVDVMMECLGGTAAVAVSQSDHIKMTIRLIGEQWFHQQWHLPDAVTKTPKDIDWAMLGGSILAGGIAVYLSQLGRTWLKKVGTPGAKSKALAYATLGAGGIVSLTAGVMAFQFVTRLPSVNLLSVAVIWTVTAILLRGIKETAWFTNAFTILKLAVLAVVIVVFACHYDPANLNLPVEATLPGSLAGASVAFFAFVGLDLATTTAGEVKNPKRNVPWGMLIGLACVTVLYFLASYFLCAAVDYHKLGEGKEGDAAPMIRALEILGYKQLAIWVGIGSTLALLSVVIASAYSTTRLLYNMAQHGLLPEIFEQVSTNKRGFFIGQNVPVFSTLAVGGTISVLTGLMAVDELMHLTNIGTMTAFITISLTVLILIVRETEWKKPRQAAKGVLWVVIAVLGMIGPFILMMQLPWVAFVRLFAVWALVVVLFVRYSRHHSLAKKQLDARKDEENKDGEKKGE
ncbi:MAG: APC family permease [Candidatus Obscuribacterales bacterium]|nr:APC family permease [Candidatus Obscuribacterales bacterium]